MEVKVFIGYDERESIAAEVCKYSIETRSNLKCRFLKSSDILEYGRIIQEPQSTDFTFTRFWVPYLSNYEGVSIFCDCDFLFHDDIEKLVQYASGDNPVSVVKHPDYTPKSQIKMDGIPQHEASMKNWASLMVFRNDLCKNLTPEYLNTIIPGRRLHNLEWADNKIGEIPLEWNVLDGYYDVFNPKAIHFTDGGPWFDDYKNTQFSYLWLEELRRYNG